MKLFTTLLCLMAISAPATNVAFACNKGHCKNKKACKHNKKCPKCNKKKCECGEGEKAAEAKPSGEEKPAN